VYSKPNNNNTIIIINNNTINNTINNKQQQTHQVLAAVRSDANAANTLLLQTAARANTLWWSNFLLWLAFAGASFAAGSSRL
jgi:hypothetical protein